MKNISLRLMLLATALFIAAPAWAQDQSKPDAVKSDAAKKDAPVKTADATPPAKADAIKPTVIDASKDVSKDQPMVIDASKDASKDKPVRVAQKDQVPTTQDSTEGRSIPG